MRYIRSSLNYRGILCAGMMGGLILMAPLNHVALAVDGDSNTVDTLKNQLINDPKFIEAIAGAVKTGTTDDHIRQVVKDYLVKNPEIMLEVQEALNQQQQNKTAESQSASITAMKDQIFNSSDDAVLGNPKGKITLVEFFDFNCGYCKKSFPDMQELIRNNPDLRVVLKDFPILGNDSVKAHIVGRAFLKLMPEKYAAFHREMLTTDGRGTEEKAIKTAVKLGVNEQKLRQTMKDEKLQQSFIDNGQIAYALNINGTPSYILGNEVLVGAVGEATLNRKIASIREK